MIGLAYHQAGPGPAPQRKTPRSTARHAAWWLATGMLAAVLSGCGIAPPGVSSAGGGGTSTTATGLSGTVHGGQQPVSGSTIQLWQVGITGYGQGAAPLGASVQSDANGNFNLTGAYSCSNAAGGGNTPVYITATGGNPGLATGTNNTAITMMAALGPCGNLTSSTFISMNEVTTAAAAFALAQFMNVSGGVGAYASSAGALANAFGTAGNLANTATGLSLALTPNGNGIAPQTKLDTIADVLAACVNSAGPTSSSCTTLFSSVAPVNGTAPTTTLGAALSMALNPGRNVSTLLSLASPSAPFQPTLPSANDWTLTIGYASGGGQPDGLAIDGSGNVWVSNYGTGGATSSVSLLSPLGIPAANSPYAAGGAVNGVRAVAVDLSNNAWVANGDNNSAVQLSVSGSGAAATLATAGGPYTGSLNAPKAVAVDASSNVWFVNSGNNSLTQLLRANLIGAGNSFTSFGLNTPTAIAFDNLGSAWVTNSGNGTVTDVMASATTVTAATYTAGGLSSPSSVSIDSGSNVWLTDSVTAAAAKLNDGGIALSPAGGYTGSGIAAANASAMDGSGSFWIANAQANSVAVVNAAGAGVTPSGGYQDASLSSPSAIAIDASGNVWVANKAPVVLQGKTITVSEVVGAASPAVVPLALAVKQRQLGVRPGTALLPAASAGGPYAGTAGATIAFSAAASFDPNSEALTYIWSFGDGSVGSGVTVQHPYATAGQFAVTLTVTNTDGVSNSVGTRANIVAAAVRTPIASIGGPYTGTSGSAVSFDGTASSDPSNVSLGALALTMTWNFGDGATGYGATPAHTYTSPGTYTVSLTVTSASGGTAASSTTASITQGAPTTGAPAANANGPYTGTAGAPVQFSNAGSSDPNNLALTYRWDFGDGASVFASNPTHSYLQKGSYSVVLTVNNGSQSTTTSSVATISAPSVQQLSASAGGPYTAQLNQIVQLDGSATTNPNSGLLVYTWDFGDGSTGTGVRPYHIYSTQGTYRVNLSVSDGIGISGNATAQVTVGPAPAEAISLSAGGPYANTPAQAITFDASATRDNLNYPLTYTWNFGDGNTGTGLNPTHAYTAAGSYTVTLTASSGTATATGTATVTITPQLTVTIATPAANTLFTANTVTVSGTVSAANATVSVNGVAATVSGNSFTASGVQLREGVNILTATAAGAAGAIGTGSVSVIQDVTPPGIAIMSPASGAAVTQSSVTVSGLVNDIVTGTIGSNDVTVMVNGQAAQVSNRSFMLSGVLLAPGANTITATVTDKVGNTSSTTATINYVQPVQKLNLHVLSGDGQTGAVKSLLPQPLVVQLVAANGTPVSGRPVTFTVSRSDGMVEVMPNVTQSLYVTTDANGKASVLFMLGSRQGLGINQVTASTPGAAGTVTFNETTTAGAPSQIHAVRGENQRGLLGAALAEGFQVIVTDSFANPVPGVSVNFTSMMGDGTLDHSAVATDSNGKAIATLTLGQQEGYNNYVVKADFTGNAGKAPTFSASGYAPGPAAMTKVSGVVLDNANLPIPNATVRLLNTSLSTVTATDGTFTISGAPVGIVTLTVDGSTSTRTQTFPFLSFLLQDLPGVNNTLNKPIYLPFIDVNDAQTVGGSDAVTIPIKGVPGASMTVMPNSVTFPDGSNVGQLSVSQVKSDMVPMEPTNGSAPDLIWTIQPAGTKFNPPIRVTMPNTQGLAPGTVSEFYQFDHDLEQFVSAGTAHVSADGSVIVSDSGFGISKAGWGHAPSFPLPQGCVQSCDDHNVCTDDSIDPNNCRACINKGVDGRACGNQTADPNSCLKKGTCYGAFCDAGWKPDNTPCDNGIFCQRPETCQGGQCIGKQIPPVPVTLINGAVLKFEQAFESGVEPMYVALRSLNVPLNLEPTFTPSGSGQTSCCEAKKQLDTQQLKSGLQVGLKLSFPKIPLPPPFDLFYVPFVGSVGLYVSADVQVTGGVDLTSDTCTDMSCFSGGPAVSVTLEGGVLAQAGAAASANVGITGGIKVGLTVGCGQATFDVGLQPINLVLGYTTFGGKQSSLEIPLKAGTDLGAVSYPLN